MFELEVFRKQMYCIEESIQLVTLLGFFGASAVIWRPRVIPRPGNSLITPLTVQDFVKTLLSNLHRG